EELGMRVVRLRIGVVLGHGGGAVKKMAEPFKFFLGGALGSGTQWMSWIHLDDLVGLIVRVMEGSQIQGAVNATAPNPLQNTELSKILGKVMRRPSWVQAPSFVLKMALGDMADVLLTGQRVIPTAAEKF